MIKFLKSKWAIIFALLFFSSTPGHVYAYPASDEGNTVLILGTTVAGSPSLEESVASGLGYSVEVVFAEEWSVMTTTDFATYRALIIGDPFCHRSTDVLAPAESNTSVWGPAVTGNVFVIGSDPQFHSKSEVIRKGIEFAAADSTKLGAYISLSCYYDDAELGTPVRVLDAFEPSGFTVIGGNKLGVLNNIQLVATHPALNGLVGDTLSYWGSSVQEAFTSWPLAFEVLGLAVDGDKMFTAPNGTKGVPYILTRGARVISDISLLTSTTSGPVGADYSVTAALDEVDTPDTGYKVRFTVIDGPSTGISAVHTAGESGKATFSWKSLVAGVDTLEASYESSGGKPQRSNRVKKEWVGIPPITCNAGDDASVNENSRYGLDGNSSSGGVGELTYSWEGPYYMDDPLSAIPSFMSPVVDGSKDTEWTLTVSDEEGQEESCSVFITIIDSDLPPDCSNATAAQQVLWPPNHKFVPVVVTGVVDTENSEATVIVTGVTQDEPVNGLGSGDMAPDTATVEGVTNVRAERSGDGDGRVYEVQFTATDSLGQSCAGSITVGVPHNKKDNPVDSGQLFDATEG